MSKTKRVHLNQITKAYNEMKSALEFYKKGIGHFYKCINFKASHLDAEAIAFMNDSEIKISNALKLANEAPEIIEA